MGLTEGSLEHRTTTLSAYGEGHDASAPARERV